jgi:hypothetical protein
LNRVLYKDDTRLGKRLKKTPYSNLFGRPRIIEPEGKFAEDMKSFVTEYNKEHTSAIMDQLMKELTENFENLKLSKATLHRYMTGLWEPSFKKAKLEPIERSSPAKI